MECHCCLDTKQSWFKKWRLPVSAIILLCYLFIFMMNNGKMDTSNLSGFSEARSEFVLKDSENLLQNLREKKTWAMTKELKGNAARRLLGGPGSSPPRCYSKCGRCTPCKPVHVPVPPGTPVTTEYYPEAWRCKCGNRLYMP